MRRLLAVAAATVGEASGRGRDLAAAMQALLRVTSGQRAGEEIALRAGEVLSIGRSAESDLHLLDL